MRVMMNLEGLSAHFVPIPAINLKKGISLLFFTHKVLIPMNICANKTPYQPLFRPFLLANFGNAATAAKIGVNFAAAAALAVAAVVAA